MKKEISGPIAAIVLAAALIFLGVFLYRGASGGVQGDGKVGNVEASPPMGPGARQGMAQQQQRPR